MSAVTASLCSTLMFVLFVSADQKTITAESGQDVTLTCRPPDNNNNIVEWSRADLGDEYVLLYRDGHFVPDNQHPSFKNRVDLQDRQMKDGDVSLILKNVTINDTGTYECGVVQTGTEYLKLIISIIYLHVDPPDPTVITIESGQNVTLTCRATNNITVVKWSRADFTSSCVFLYQDGHFIPDHQHPSFKNRVDLQDRQMKDGDVSLILKDVTINDTGRYVCGDYMKETRSWKSISIIHLVVVVPPGPSGGIIGLIVALLLLLVGVVGFLIYRKHKVSRYSIKVPTEDNEAPQSPQQDCVRGQTEVNYPEPPADGLSSCLWT
ncbi:polymeric immunoglobulin receptor-like [Pelmatolapia mariae]|uniref:polymeric immunoglobulin receptor-like n=1 Tax=Pelmatolapia mariae TaxID=158779 RepID=UPI002FE55075